jgi:hypothetical protein
MNHRKPPKNDERGHVVNENIVAGSNMMETCIATFEVTFNNISSFSATIHGCVTHTEKLYVLL